MNELFCVLVTTFEAARYLDSSKARALVLQLPEPVYELALDYYDSQHKGYYYYLVRLVLDSLENESEYCCKAHLKENLALYREMVESLQKPSAVMVKGELVAFNQMELFP
jgi:hypothetical protein